MIRFRTGALLVALAAITVGTHWPSLSGGFIWDDDDHLTANPYVASPTGLRNIWSSLAVSRYYPLTLTSFWVLRQVFGLHPLPYHALNLAFHTANAVLLYLLLRRLAVRGAWVAAALWAVHPVMVESVAWITELKNTQSTFFFLLAWWCYLNFEAMGRRRHYVWALVAFAAALTSKPATVMLPVLLLLGAWWERNRVSRSDWLRAAPFFLLSAGMSLLTIVEQQRHVHGAATTEWQLTLVERCRVAGKAVWFYAGKLLAPVDLAFVYPRWELRDASLWPFVALIALAITLGWLHRQPWARAGLFGGTCFVAALAPVLGFFDVYYFRFSFVSDHFNYLPSGAFLALLTAAVATVVQEARGRVLVTAAALVVLAGLSWHRATVFRSDERLWHDTLAQNPASALAHNNLGAIYQRRGQRAAAIAHYEQAQRLGPTMWEPRINLGKLFLDEGASDRAMACFQSALATHPNLVEARYGLGVVHLRAGRLAEARQAFAAGLQLRPDNAQLHFWLGRVAEQDGQMDEAIAHYVEAVRLEPRLVDAYLHLGELRLQRGERDRAIRCFEAVLRWKPDDAQARAGRQRALELLP